ncbi:MAG: putative ATPase, partial [Rhizobacter sp.]|nr:putative ATPase [Rhizobacter sp.]
MSAADSARPAHGLAGRDAEMALLREQFALARNGCRLVVISGRSGIGKSAMAAALASETLEAGGRAAFGKFDQFLSSAAFSVPLQALARLCRALSAEPESRKRVVRDRIVHAVGTNVGGLAALVPSFLTLLGLDPAAAAADVDRHDAGSQQTERLKLGLADALRATASVTEPLLLVLDDIQWADAPTLALLADLMFDHSARGLCIVVTCRSAGLDDGQPFGRWLAEVDADGSRSGRIALEPLSEDGVTALVSGMLGADRPDLADIVRRIRLASAGNPLHLMEAVRAVIGTSTEAAAAPLPANDALAQPSGEPEQAEAPSGDMRSLLAVRLQRLGTTERHLLTIAACMGGVMAASLLAAVAACGDDIATAAIASLVDSGLLQVASPTAMLTTRDADPEFRIAHDQIQAAVRASTPDALWKETHRRISDVLADSGLHELQAGIHLAEAMDLLDQPAPRLAGLRRFARAAEAARRSAAFESALQ